MLLILSLAFIWCQYGVGAGRPGISPWKLSHPGAPFSLRSLSHDFLGPKEVLTPNAVCMTLPWLTRRQLGLCTRSPEAMASALQGVHLAIHECQHQLQERRWDCSDLSSGGTMLLNSPILKREASSKFKPEIKVSLLGRQEPQQATTSNTWAQPFLHVVSELRQRRCKCHGPSGSCQFRTCWLSPPDFQLVGSNLKERMDQAILLRPHNSNSGAFRPRLHSSRLAKHLIFYEPSPDFCEPDLSLGSSGTHGRSCVKGSIRPDGCGSLCCGRGHNVLQEIRAQRCHCRFLWCCHVQCEECPATEWVSICK
ncbi:hypothetical protein JD844_011010 [Phrynosoma platyrhinos]|uniref:Protein Wnt n=1 Tax=Phrynosoma platyrhinos TaxID=52577 RepID=A0ABQ7THB1_PHRPL|nr:hypothetical protein JD844_011010 [Phrynosoma platyrhinos]